MLRALKVIARRCILHQRAIQIISALFCFPESLKNVSESAVVTAFERLIVNYEILDREDGGLHLNIASLVKPASI